VFFYGKGSLFGRLTVLFLVVAGIEKVFAFAFDFRWWLK